MHGFEHRKTETLVARRERHDISASGEFSQRGRFDAPKMTYVLPLWVEGSGCRLKRSRTSTSSSGEDHKDIGMRLDHSRECVEKDPVVLVGMRDSGVDDQRTIAERGDHRMDGAMYHPGIRGR